MSNLLNIIAALALIAGGLSTAYYYSIYIPEKEATVQEHIQEVQNPTPQQQAAQKAANIKALHESDAKVKAYGDCLMKQSNDLNSYTSSKCSSNTGDYLKYTSCATEAMKTFKYDKDCRELLY